MLFKWLLLCFLLMTNGVKAKNCEPSHYGTSEAASALKISTQDVLEDMAALNEFLDCEQATGEIGQVQGESLNDAEKEQLCRLLVKELERIREDLGTCGLVASAVSQPAITVPAASIPSTPTTSTATTTATVPVTTPSGGIATIATTTTLTSDESNTKAQRDIGSFAAGDTTDSDIAFGRNTYGLGGNPTPITPAAPLSAQPKHSGTYKRTGPRPSRSSPEPCRDRRDKWEKPRAPAPTKKGYGGIHLNTASRQTCDWLTRTPPNPLCFLPCDCYEECDACNKEDYYCIERDSAIVACKRDSASLDTASGSACSLLQLGLARTAVCKVTAKLFLSLACEAQTKGYCLRYTTECNVCRADKESLQGRCGPENCCDSSGPGGVGLCNSVCCPDGGSVFTRNCLCG